MADDNNELTTRIGATGVEALAPAGALGSPASRSTESVPAWGRRRRATIVDVHPNSMAARKWGRREWISLHDERGRPRST